MMNTMLGSLSVGTSPSLFASGSTLSMLNAKGSAAMSYLTPQAAPAGQNVNTLA
jgi:hypothetical protein